MGHGGHLGNVVWFYTHTGSAFLLMLLMNFGFDCPSVFRGNVIMMSKYYGNIHVYCTGVGANEPLESNFMFRIIDIQSYCPFPARVSLQMAF